MSNVTPDILKRTELAQFLLARRMDEADFEIRPQQEDLLTSRLLAAGLPLGDKYPDGLAPTPQPPDVPPDPALPLARADVLVITWTVDEQERNAENISRFATPQHLITGRLTRRPPSRLTP